MVVLERHYASISAFNNVAEDFVNVETHPLPLRCENRQGPNPIYHTNPYYQQ